MGESKYVVLETITMWWPLGGAGVGEWIFPYDLSHDHIGHTHRSRDRSCGISHTHKQEEDTARWHKGGVGHTHFCLLIQCM